MPQVIRQLVRNSLLAVHSYFIFSVIFHTYNTINFFQMKAFVADMVVPFVMQDTICCKMSSHLRAAKFASTCFPSCNHSAFAHYPYSQGIANTTEVVYRKIMPNSWSFFHNILIIIHNLRNRHMRYYQP